mgnify:CR=1 FL=1
MNRVTVPIFTLDAAGDVLPNPLFHRSWDKLHSRCIEYPYAASRLGEVGPVLDVGTVKTDPAWISWLESLKMEVHATDYDPPKKPFTNVTFTQSDVRDLPYDDDTFAVILAVSVIEHIGLDVPQVELDNLPVTSREGDVDAVRELMRVLKPDGKLVMTLPFGVVDGLILGDKSARGYTRDSLRRFEAVARPQEIHYYEYQKATKKKRAVEFTRPMSLKEHVSKSLKHRLGLGTASRGEVAAPAPPPEIPGRVTWRRIPIEDASATHRQHTDGVICGIWSPHS